MRGKHDLARPVFWLAILALVLLVAACGQAAPAAQPTTAPAAPKAAATTAPAAPKAAATTAPAAPAPTAAPAASKYPEKPVELGVTGAAGGGLDQMARGIEEALNKEKLFPGTLTIQYYDGGGGSVGMAALNEQKGSGYHMMVNSNRVYLQQMIGRTPLGVADFTAIARLASDFEVIAVRNDSRFKSATELFDALKADPKSVSIGHGSGPNDDQLQVLQAAKAYGVDFVNMNMVAFAAGGDVMTNLLGGHVDVISTGSSEALPQVKSGDVRVLAVSSPERLTGDRADFPTFKEQGIDLVLYHWRGIYGPKDMAKDGYDFWIDAYGKMAKSATWKEILERYKWDDALLLGDDFRKSLEEEEEAAREVLEPLGILKK